MSTKITYQATGCSGYSLGVFKTWEQAKQAAGNAGSVRSVPPSNMYGR